MEDSRSSFTNNAGSRSWGTTGSTQPGEAAAGTHPGGATAGTQPGGAAAGSQPGGAAAGTQPGGAAAGTQPGEAAAGSLAGGATGCQTATWSQVKKNNGDSTDGRPYHFTEEAQDQHYKTIHPWTNYSVFFINTVGWLFTKTRKPRKLGGSVCKVVIEYKDDKNDQKNCEGTGFVLVGNLIMTNAHLFIDYIEGYKLRKGVKVSALFYNFEDTELHTNYYYFQLAHQNIFYSYGELDYAILELNPEGHKPNQMVQMKFSVPPGLLNKFGPMPLNGEACIIGHPAGEVKKMDQTFIIEKEKREQAVNNHLHQYKDKPFTLYSIKHLLKQQGIENIMVGGNRAEKVLTYNTFMYFGSSGSPVFDAHGQVVGLHTRGYVYGFPKHEVSVIEYAQSLLVIFEHLVRALKESGNQELFMRIKEGAKGNRNLENILSSVRKRKASSTEESAPKAKCPRTE